MTEDDYPQVLQRALEAFLKEPEKNKDKIERIQHILKSIQEAEDCGAYEISEHLSGDQNDQ